MASPTPQLLDGGAWTYGDLPPNCTFPADAPAQAVGIAWSTLAVYDATANNGGPATAYHVTGVQPTPDFGVPGTFINVRDSMRGLFLDSLHVSLGLIGIRPIAVAMYEYDIPAFPADLLGYEFVVITAGDTPVWPLAMQTAFIAGASQMRAALALVGFDLSVSFAHASYVPTQNLVAAPAGGGSHPGGGGAPPGGGSQGGGVFADGSAMMAALLVAGAAALVLVAAKE